MRSAVTGSPEHQMTTEHEKSCSILPANSRKEPKRQERKQGADPAHLRRSTTLAPSWTVKPTFEITHEKAFSTPGEKYSNSALIVLFGALGAVVPIILLLLGGSGALDLIGLAIVVWPTSIFMASVQQSPGHTASAFLLPVLSNVAIYLVFGSLLWLGLVRPRSIVYLTVVGLMYLTIVGVAGFCELLLG